MTALRIGTTITDVPGLEGRWSVWSQAADAPGAFFLVPHDDPARALGVKYAVIRALNRASQTGPELNLIRTDPARPDLLDAAERQQRSAAR